LVGHDRSAWQNTGRPPTTIFAGTEGRFTAVPGVSGGIAETPAARPETPDSPESGATGVIDVTPENDHDGYRGEGR